MLDKAYEENRLSAVRKIIAAQIAKLAADIRHKHGHVTETRDLMWAETHVIRNFDDVAYLNTLLDEITEQERHYGGMTQALARLKRLLNAPYFGRIDFTEDGYSDTEEIYIGIHSLFDEAQHSYWVYDWRAPISSLFYDYGVGRASFKAPDGVISGDIHLKRQYKIAQGNIVFMCDSDLTIDDDILQLELSKSSDARIKTIINSIQREQNRAIRCDAENVLVFGPAGSGKTSVGLHRLAYLLYKFRGTLSSGGVRIFSSNYIFSTYIAGVIPELGEDDVVTLDFKDLLKTHLHRNFYDMYEQIDYLLDIWQQGNTDITDIRVQCIAMKYSKAFVTFAAQYVRQYKPTALESVYFFDTLICDKAKMMDLYEDRTAIGNLATKTERVLSYVNQRLEEYYTENARPIRSIFEQHYDDHFTEVEAREKFDEYKSIALGRLKSQLFPDSSRLYEQTLRRFCKTRKPDAAPVKFTLQAMCQARIFFEDALMLLYIGVLTGAVRQDTTVRHILIDEAQDMSYLQHCILAQIFSNCRFTVLADVNQALYPHINIMDTQTLVDLYQPQNIVELTKSYRSTFAINRFAAQHIGVFCEERFYKREGDEPTLVSVGADTPTTAATLVAGMRKAAAAAAEIINHLPETYGSIGVLLRDSRQAEAFYNALAPILPADKVVHIADADDEFKTGVVVMAVSYAKGLEFDAVIIPGYDDTFFAGKLGKRIVYLMCTRALHRLYLLTA